jgi:hypothetical protein
VLQLDFVWLVSVARIEILWKKQKPSEFVSLIGEGLFASELRMTLRVVRPDMLDLEGVLAISVNEIGERKGTAALTL